MSGFGIRESGFRISAVVALLLTTLSATANATDRVWLVGGGYDLQNSQVQIEQNVLWARAVLQALPGERSIQTYFNDGDDPAPDVTWWQKPTDTATTLQPLARVYDADYVNGEAIRSHTIAPVDGPATRQTLLDELPQAIERLAPGEQGLLIYAGHGSPGEHSSLLDLWGDEHFNADDLRTLLTAQPRATTLRFVFTQCFAGGFHTALLPQVGAPQRCGFYAVAQDQLAEGCTASLDVAEYRGYGTYFFAALTGQTRTGAALSIEPDRNQDGRGDPSEAHLYTLRAARSTDVPRSTSEQYLMDWAPWYFPLLRVAPRADNPYAEIVQGLQRDLEIAAPLRDALYVRRKQAEQELTLLTVRQEQARERAQTAMWKLQAEVERRWPAARSPYTLAYTRFLARDLDAAQGFIQAHTLYPDLITDQDAYWTLDNAILTLQRQLALYDRIEHLQQLARLRDVLLEKAGEADRAVYLRLLGCEQRPL